RRVERGENAALRDLVEGEALETTIAVRAVPERLGQMPRDRLPFAIGVRSEIDGVRLPRALLQLLQNLCFALDEDVGGLEALLDIHAQLALGQVPHVTVGGAHLEPRAEILPDGAGLGRGLHDDEILAALARTRS